MLSTVDMVVQRRDGPRQLRDDDDDGDEVGESQRERREREIFPSKVIWASSGQSLVKF